MARQLQCERPSIGATFSSLFARNLDFPLQRIFLSLDPVSLKNSRLVRKEWNYFIKSRVWGTIKDTEPNSRLRQRLSYHWMHATPTVKSTGLQLDRPSWGPWVHSLSCDDTVVVCGLYDDRAKVYDLVSLNLLAVLDCLPPDCSGDSGKVTSDVGRDVVATGTRKGHVSVWRKDDWSNVFKECLHGDYHVTHVKVVANLIITGGRDARLAMLSWDGDQVSLMRMIEKESVFSNVTGLDSDGVWLLYAINVSQTHSRRYPELKVWNLHENKMIHSYSNREVTSIHSVVLNYPYAVVGSGYMFVKVMDLRTGDLLQKSWCYELIIQAQIINHNKTILVGSNDPTYGGRHHSVYFCDIRQIANPQQNGPHWRRRKYFEKANNSLASLVKACVNTSCVVAVRGNELHVWDFWNSNDISDSPDEFINDTVVSERDHLLCEGLLFPWE